MYIFPSAGNDNHDKDYNDDEDDNDDDDDVDNRNFQRIDRYHVIS